MTDMTRDAIIVGGGLAGMTLAIALARHGLTSHVVDALDLATTLVPTYDGRASAIASASQRMFAALGLWDDLADQAQPIWEIRVVEGQSPLYLHFDAADSNSSDEALGYLVENRQLRHVLQKHARADPHITLHAPAHIRSLTRDQHSACVQLADGSKLCAPLVIGADGRLSWVRKQAGLRLTSWSYHQAAVIVSVAHEHPHGDIAHELFTPEGPFAILPLVDDTGPQGVRHRSAVVFTVAEHQAAAFMALSERAFQAEVARRFGDFLGAIEVITPRWSYPLSVQFAERLIADRLALVGDAGHAIHPIAGQGLNVGFRDVAALAEILTVAAHLGQDLGEAQILTKYDRWRRTDITSMVAATDVLNRLFSNNWPVLRRARRLGLGAVQRIPALKQFFMAEARGQGGKLPKLLLGLGLQ